MYNPNNKTELIKIVKNMKKDEKLYINTISISIPTIEQLRTYIKNGILIPLKPEVEKMYNDVDNVMNGNVILPQMTYLKL